VNAPRTWPQSWASKSVLEASLSYSAIFNELTPAARPSEGRRARVLDAIKPPRSTP